MSLSGSARVTVTVVPSFLYRFIKDCSLYTSSDVISIGKLKLSSFVVVGSLDLSRLRS